MPLSGRGSTRGHPRRTTLTSRAAVLALVLCALVVMLADPLQAFLGQRSQIARQEDANQALQRRVEALEGQQRLWSDPAYVRQQARERLYYVMPGETPYVIVGHPRRGTGGSAGASSAGGGGAAVAGGAAAGASSTAVTVAGGSTWYGRLWSSVRQAGTADDGSSGAVRGTTDGDAPAKRRPAPAPIRPGSGG